MTITATSSDRAVFYRASVLGLRALDARERNGRRFGDDADARWAQFAGALRAGDRIDILLRDAAGTWGSAFSPADCFGLFGLAEDEPFGPDWQGIDDQSAARLVADSSAAPNLDDVAAVLGVRAETLAIPAVSPSTKLAVAGGAALLAVAKIFGENRALSWTDQVLVVAEKPIYRQLAGLAAVLLGARGRTVVIRPGEDAAAAGRAAGFAHLDAAIVSSDAEPVAAELARSLGGR